MRPVDTLADTYKRRNVQMRTPRTELFKDGARVGIWCRVALRHAKMASDSFKNFCLPHTQSSASGFIEQEKS